MTTHRAGGWKRIGEGPRTRTVSKRVFEFTGNAPIDYGVAIEKGSHVRLLKLPGCPGPGTMGHYHVGDPETGDLFGMVAYGSLEALPASEQDKYAMRDTSLSIQARRAAFRRHNQRAVAS